MKVLNHLNAVYVTMPAVLRPIYKPICCDTATGNHMPVASVASDTRAKLHSDGMRGLIPMVDSSNVTSETMKNRTHCCINNATKICCL